VCLALGLHFWRRPVSTTHAHEWSILLAGIVLLEVLAEIYIDPHASFHLAAFVVIAGCVLLWKRGFLALLAIALVGYATIVWLAGTSEAFERGSLHVLLALFLATVIFFVRRDGIRRFIDEIGSINAERMRELQRLATSLEQSIAEREQVERSLRKSQERFAYAMQAANDGVWDWNLETGEVYYSPRWKEMLGYGEKEVAFQYAEWERLVHPEDRERVKNIRAASLARGEGHYVVEFRMHHKDGRYIDILCRTKVVRRGTDGSPSRIIGTHTDITAHKQAEARLRSLNASLEERVRGRTAELLEANDRLEHELAERQRTEAELNEAKRHRPRAGDL
jgi:PAS domain S-box-containing protein